MAVLHDLRCTACEHIDRNVGVVAGRLGHCRCGGARVIDWSHGKAPATDLHAPTFNHATGAWHQSCREADMAMAKHAKGWEERTGRKWHAYPAGDKVGGARQELKIHGSGFSYAGQASRRSSHERAQERRGVNAPPKPKQLHTMRDGTPARRVTGEQHREMVRSPVWRG
jgi:hypothetical protein